MRFEATRVELLGRLLVGVEPGDFRWTLPSPTISERVAGPATLSSMRASYCLSTPAAGKKVNAGTRICRHSWAWVSSPHDKLFLLAQQARSLAKVVGDPSRVAALQSLARLYEKQAAELTA